MQCATRKVGESYIDCRGDVGGLVTLQGERKRHIATTVAGRRLIEGLIGVFEMYYRRGVHAGDWLQIFRDSGINGNRRISAGRIV